MSNVIDFLERMGQDAQLRDAMGLQLEEALVKAEITPEVRAAIAAGDPKQIQLLLGIQSNVCAIIFPSDSDERTGGFDEYNKLAVSAR